MLRTQSKSVPEPELPSSSVDVDGGRTTDLPDNLAVDDMVAEQPKEHAADVPAP